MELLSCSCKKGSCVTCNNCSNCGCTCRRMRARMRRHKKKRKTQNQGVYEEEDSSADDTSAVRNNSTQHHNSINQLLNFFGLDTSLFKSLPGKRKREQMAFDDVSEQERGRTIHLMTSVIDEVARIVWPCDPDGVRSALLSSRLKDGKLVANIQSIVDVIPRRSTQCDALLAPVAKTYDAIYLNEKFGIGKVQMASLRENKTQAEAFFDLK